MTRATTWPMKSARSWIAGRLTLVLLALPTRRCSRHTDPPTGNDDNVDCYPISVLGRGLFRGHRRLHDRKPPEFRHHALDSDHVHATRPGVRRAPLVVTYNTGSGTQMKSWGMTGYGISPSLGAPPRACRSLPISASTGKSRRDQQRRVSYGRDLRHRE